MDSKTQIGLLRVELKNAEFMLETFYLQMKKMMRDIDASLINLEKCQK